MTWPEAKQADLCGRICVGASQLPGAAGTVEARRDLGPCPATTTDLLRDLEPVSLLYLPFPHLAEVSSCAQVAERITGGHRCPVNPSVSPHLSVLVGPQVTDTLGHRRSDRLLLNGLRGGDCPTGLGGAEAGEEGPPCPQRGARRCSGRGPRPPPPGVSHSLGLRSGGRWFQATLLRRRRPRGVLPHPHSSSSREPGWLRVPRPSSPARRGLPSAPTRSVYCGGPVPS